MTDWKAIAASLDPAIPPEDAERIAPVLDALEAVFRPLADAIPAGSDIWSGPE